MANYALTFASGSTSYVLVKSSKILGGLSTYSMSAWFKSSADLSLFSRPIYCERSNSGSDILKLDMFNAGADAGKIGLTYRDDAGVLNQIKSASAYNDGVVHHVVIVNNAGSITIYVDGSSAGTGSITASTNFTNASLESRIGGDKGDSNANWGGIIEDVKLWTTALTSGNVTTEYTGGNVSSGQVDWWKFDEGTGTSAADSTGANTGTLSGTSTPTWVAAINPYDVSVSNQYLPMMGMG